MLRHPRTYAVTFLPPLAQRIQDPSLLPPLPLQCRDHQGHHGDGYVSNDHVAPPPERVFHPRHQHDLPPSPYEHSAARFAHASLGLERFHHFADELPEFAPLVPSLNHGGRSNAQSLAHVGVGMDVWGGVKVTDIYM